MEQDKYVHCGYLQIPSQGKIVLKVMSMHFLRFAFALIIVLFQKNSQQKYCLLFKQSKSGIERLEIYDSIDDVSKHVSSKIITLENCVKITPVSPVSFKIITKNNVQHDFTAISEHDLNEWVTAIQSVAFKDDVSKITSIEEDNDLYCSSGEGIFSVTLQASDASKKCGLEPNKTYTLAVMAAAIQLRNFADNKVLYTWPYCYIRRYGCRSGKFTFEAGRKCESGEGLFQLEHSSHQEIFRFVKLFIIYIFFTLQLLKNVCSSLILFYLKLKPQTRKNSS